MRVLVACEYSGVVREAFAKRGHDAWSCDLDPTEIPGNHYQCDVREVINNGWDLMIAHPPCTHLAVCGAPSFHRKQIEQLEALEFVNFLMNSPIEKICIENPISIISSRIRKPEQIIQPYWFGDAIQKKTCLWLKNLPVLKPTKIVLPEIIKYNSISKKQGYSTYSKHWKHKKDRKERSKFFPGVAQAMAEQWG